MMGRGGGVLVGKAGDGVGTVAVDGDNGVSTASVGLSGLQLAIPLSPARMSGMDIPFENRLAVSIIRK